MPPVIGVNCMHTENVIYINGCLIYAEYVPSYRSTDSCSVRLVQGHSCTNKLQYVDF